VVTTPSPATLSGAGLSESRAAGESDPYILSARLTEDIGTDPGNLSECNQTGAPRFRHALAGGGADTAVGPATSTTLSERQCCPKVRDTDGQDMAAAPTSSADSDQFLENLSCHGSQIQGKEPASWDKQHHRDQGGTRRASTRSRSPIRRKVQKSWWEVANKGKEQMRLRIETLKAKTGVSGGSSNGGNDR
jgi:hypothetical protein